jgi:hypothetical protein
MENRWNKAVTILAPTVKICGRKLLPFCLRHRVALEEIDSPLLNLEKSMTVDQLLATVRVLSTHDFEEIRKPISWSEILLAKKLSRNKKLFIQECYHLSLYMQAQSLWPRFWVKDSDAGKSSSVAWTLAVVTSLMRNGCTYEQAWTMPESEAIWMHIAHSQANGSSVEIVSDHEWQAMENYKREQAEKQKAEQTTKTK